VRCSAPAIPAATRRQLTTATRSAALAVVLSAALTVPVGTASAATLPVTIAYQTFTPNAFDALPGDTVTWTNNGGRTHTVTADDGQFDSGDVPDGDHFTQTFTAPGTYTYHCTIHRGMVGEVDVRRITLSRLPTGPVPTGGRVEMGGRTADLTAPVLIEREAGNGFQTVATATPGGDGTWAAAVIVTKTGRYRAVAGADVSEARRLVVNDRHVQVHPIPGGVSVRVIPAAPHALIGLQLYLRERFGWWPVKNERLDGHSRASFPVRGPVRARVALLEPDGWTPLALSPVIRVRTGSAASQTR
jgi:plastocyanin